MVLLTCLASQGPNQQILVGGDFTRLNRSLHLNIGRLNSDGTLDKFFNASADQALRAIAIQASDGKSVIGGDFTLVNGLNRNHIARLDLYGYLDSSFVIGTGANGPVTALQIQSDGKIVLGGNFTLVRGIARGGLARLNSNGTVDGTFTPGAVTRTGGFTITSIRQEAQGNKLIVTGLFDAIGSVARRNVVRLNSNGSVDENFAGDPDLDPTAGPDDIVRALALQPDGKPLLGGDFITVDNLERPAAARLSFWR